MASENVTYGNGRYGITRDGGRENYWSVLAGSANDFTVTFDPDIAAFGFYGIDVSDFGGQLELELSGVATTTLNVPSTIGSGGSTDGLVLFFGFISDDPTEQVSSVRFPTTESASRKPSRSTI